MHHIFSQKDINSTRRIMQAKIDIGYINRNADLSKLSKEQQSYIKECQNLYSLMVSLQQKIKGPMTSIETNGIKYKKMGDNKWTKIS